MTFLHQHILRSNALLNDSAYHTPGASVAQ